MDDVVNRFAREAGRRDRRGGRGESTSGGVPREARAAGFEMKVTLEAVVGFVSRSQSAA